MLVDLDLEAATVGMKIDQNKTKIQHNNIGYDVGAKETKCGRITVEILSEEEMSLLILNIFPNIDKISTEESNDFLIMVMSYFDNKNRFENILKKVESEYSKKYGKGTNYNNEFVQNLIKSLNSKFDKI